MCVSVCFRSAFVGGLKDVAAHLQSDQLATVSTDEIYFNRDFFMCLNTKGTGDCTFWKK